MNRRLVVGILVVALLVLGAVTVGGLAYNAGVARGLADSGKLVAPQAGWTPYGYGMPYMGLGGWGFGFGFLRCVVPLLGFFLLFSLVRLVFWRGRWGGRHGWGGYGPGGHAEGPGGQNVPPMFDEWHKRAHGAPEQKPGGGSA